MNLQGRLNFNDPHAVTIAELGKFTRLYPEWRVVVMNHIFFKSTVIHVGDRYNLNENHNEDKTIYIYHDLETQHYVCITAITAFIKYFPLSSASSNSSRQWCYKCCCIYGYEGTPTYCECAENIQPRPKAKIQHCIDCGEKNYKSKKHPHICGQSTCKYCQMYYKNGGLNDHRCPLYIDPCKIERVFIGDENEYFNRSDAKEEKQPYELWAWDIESHFVYAEDGSETYQYLTDENGHFIFEGTEIKVKTIKKLNHLGNYIYCKNVFTGEEKEFETLESFIEFAVITNNKGYNYFIAHNSSGYDTRLLFEAASNVSDDIRPILKGAKFMQMKIRKTVFQDSMLHLARSLKDLGESFGLEQTKGYFPHLFSTLANLEYSGIIPAKEHFDLTYSCRDQKGFDDFNKWHDEWTAKFNDSDGAEGVWNYRDQRKLYCRNDVVMLAEIMKLYHEGIIDSLKDYPYLTVSPWFFPTMAGHVHKLMIRHLHEGENIENMTVEELQDYAQTTWCALEPEEHYYARLALRGGMTNICKYVHEGKFHYQDIQSSYPSVQMDADNMYPVGSPTIEVHDRSHYPCALGPCYSNMDKCPHDYEERKSIESRHRQRKLKTIEVSPSNLHEYCLNFFGIITVDITPPKNLYHPLIQPYNQKLKKVIGTLEEIKMETMPSVILVEAIKIGYTVTKIYRADRYNQSESKFRNGLLGDLYVSKMKYAGKLTPEDHARMSQTFQDKFKITLPDISEFSKNKVRKAIAKGPITSAWGKHAESTDHNQTKLFARNGVDGMDFYNLLLLNKTVLKNVRVVGSQMMYQISENRSNKRPELHRGYLPVAVFVTAYGRLKLWKQLVTIDPPNTPREDLRVLMYDTDSIVYSCNQEMCNYNDGSHIVEGDCLGDWETEDLESDNDGLKKFYAIGPKSYAIIAGNGKTSMKLKGACIKHSHHKMLNPETFKSLVTTENSVVKLPQMSFDYALGHGREAMSTRYYLKRIQFHEKDVKGEFCREDYRGYPYGFEL